MKGREEIDQGVGRTEDEGKERNRGWVRGGGNYSVREQQKERRRASRKVGKEKGAEKTKKKG